MRSATVTPSRLCPEASARGTRLTCLAEGDQTAASNDHASTNPCVPARMEDLHSRSRFTVIRLGSYVTVRM